MVIFEIFICHYCFMSENIKQFLMRSTPGFNDQIKLRRKVSNQTCAVEESNFLILFKEITEQ